MLEAGYCKYVVVSFGHSALSGGGWERVMMASPGEEAAFGHFSAVGRYALAARRGMSVFRTGAETWKHIAVGQRAWANLNPSAIMHEHPMTDQDYYQSKWVVEPLRLSDCCLINDGGRAYVVTSLERARDLMHPPAVIMGLGQHHPSYLGREALHFEGPTGAKIAAEQALQMAGISIAEIDACEIYDCFTYTVEITLQDYGFFGPGEGEDWFKGGTIAPGGRMPVNTSGGQLSEAYFMGLTQLTEAVMQIMGRCGERQLGHTTHTREPNIIMCSDNGGLLQSHSCTLLRRL